MIFIPPSQNWKWALPCAIAGALLLAAMLFLLIPLTQMSEPVSSHDLTVREVTAASPPPPAPPPPVEETPPPPPEPELADLPDEPPPVEIRPLDLQLSPGKGEAIAMGAPAPVFAADRDFVADVERLFTFDDLPEAPRLLNVPDFQFPPQLVRRGVTEGRVTVEIDILPDGTARLARILSSTHRELEPVAERIVARARFSEPMVEGHAHTVRGRFPLILQN